MKKKLIGGLLLASIMASSLLGCGASGKADENLEEGSVINIWSWNETFRDRLNEFYPEVADVSKDKSTTTLKDGTVIKWTINPTTDNNYQNKLDDALFAQADKDVDERIDIFLLEADYALKYTSAEADVTIPLSELGITEEDLADQYKYTKEVVTDENGQIRATSWQATPGLFAYRRSIAKDILGTDDPAEVQKAIADWDAFEKTAEKAKDKGYYMLSGYDDTFRAFSNNVSTPWVTGTTLTVDPNIMNWVTQTKDFTEKGYNHGVAGLFYDAWYQDQGADSKVFGFFYSIWGINFTLEPNAGEAGYGDWAVCQGPQPFYWGGTWIAAARGTDNPEHIKDIMMKLTCDKEILKSMAETQEIAEYTNTDSGMRELAADPNFVSNFLGGQNYIEMFVEVAPDISMANVSGYDQGCIEEFQIAFHDYFSGNVDFDKAKSNFEMAIKEKYPEITEIVWP